jgi:hypothetical protein
MAKFFSGLFGGKSGRAPEEPVLSEPDLTLARAEHDIALKTQIARETWGLGDGGRWDADLEAGTITFTNERGWTIVAPLQVIGTFNTVDSTWLWGWDHPSVSESLGEHARQARAFGERYGLEWFTTRKLTVTEKDCWTFTAVASYLAGAQGGYRGPAGTTMIFLTFGTVTISNPNALGA